MARETEAPGPSNIVEESMGPGELRSERLLKGQENQNLAYPRREGLEGLSNQCARTMDFGTTDLDRRRAHRVAGCVTCHEEVAHGDRPISRVHADLDAPAMGHL